MFKRIIFDHLPETMYLSFGFSFLIFGLAIYCAAKLTTEKSEHLASLPLADDTTDKH